jgi:hypothetical protein
MDRDLRLRLEGFLRPLYQDLDGISRFDQVERIAAIAHRLHTPSSDGEERAFELLLLFHLLGRWLEKVGNLSRAVLSVGGLSEEELRATASSIRRLDDPETPIERAVAAAAIIDEGGVRGLTEHFTRARREGNSLMDILRAALAETTVPSWMSPPAATWLHVRHEARRTVCRRLLEELQLEDVPRDL